MSIILKGIDLPEKGKIILEIEPNGTVWAEGKDWQSYTEESAIQISKNHGNIIDESKAVVTETIDGYYEITAPTILDKEKE